MSVCLRCGQRHHGRHVIFVQIVASASQRLYHHSASLLAIHVCVVVVVVVVVIGFCITGRRLIVTQRYEVAHVSMQLGIVDGVLQPEGRLAQTTHQVELARRVHAPEVAAELDLVDKAFILLVVVERRRWVVLLLLLLLLSSAHLLEALVERQDVPNGVLPAAGGALVEGKVRLDPLVDLAHRQALLVRLLQRHENHARERQRRLLRTAFVFPQI